MPHQPLRPALLVLFAVDQVAGDGDHEKGDQSKLYAIGDFDSHVHILADPMAHPNPNRNADKCRKAVKTVKYQWPHAHDARGKINRRTKTRKKTSGKADELGVSQDTALRHRDSSGSHDRANDRQLKRSAAINSTESIKNGVTQQDPEDADDHRTPDTNRPQRR